MSRLARRAVVATMGSGGPTYADFETHITGLSVGVSAWGGQPFPGTRITTAAAATGIMFGTPWNSVFFAGNAATCRVVQHSLPSEAEFNAQISSGRSVLTTISSSGASFMVGIDRNGYASLSDSEEQSERSFCTQILYWSGTDTGGSAFSMIPSTGTGPTPYTW